MRVLENAGLDHRLVTKQLAGIRRLLVGLEHKLHASGELTLVVLEILGRSEQHGSMEVVPAGVHAAVSRRERKTRLLPHGKRIHISAQQDARTGRRIADGADESALDDFTGLIPHLDKPVLYIPACLRQVVPGLGMLMEPSPI